MAGNLATFFNETGVRQISFDGVEGNQSTGMGNYGEILFTNTWYQHLSSEIKQHYIADASRPTHFFWHIYTRMNWGEPWYAGFRESQTEYRLKNQPYFRRNYMPAMLGWFRMTSETTIEDVNWMLARSAAFNAGYAFVTSYEALEENGFTSPILEAIATWERARMTEAFSPEQRALMEDVNSEFVLDVVDSTSWLLTQVYPQVFRHERGERQPGEPTTTSFDFENLGAQQNVSWILTAENGTVSDVTMTIDNGNPIELPISLDQGWSLRYTGGSSAIIRDQNHQFQAEITLPAERFLLSSGRHSIVFGASLEPPAEAKARIELRPRGPGEEVKSTLSRN